MSAVSKAALFGRPIGLADDLVHGFDAQAGVEHLMHGQHHRVHADAVGHEVGRVFGLDDALAEHLAEACRGSSTAGSVAGPGASSSRRM